MSLADSLLQGSEVADRGGFTVDAVKAKEKLERFAVESIPAFNSKPMPTWIVQNVLPRAQLCVLYGAPGSGKSFTALDIVMCVARGTPWSAGIGVKVGWSPIESRISLASTTEVREAVSR